MTRGSSPNINNRKRIKATEYTSPNYQFQGMALTYHRAAPAMMQRRSTRTPMPSRQARESAEQNSARRVHFSPSVAADVPEGVNISHRRQVDPLTTPPESEEPSDVPGVPDEYAYKERVPQSFPHGLPLSSLEPGTTDWQYPPTTLFPEPPMGEHEDLLMETPLQTVAHLRDATRNL